MRLQTELLCGRRSGECCHEIEHVRGVSARLGAGGAARLQAIAAAVLFSTGGAGIKVEAFTASQVSGIRSGIAGLALLLWLRGRVRWSLPALGAGVIYAAMLTLFVAATKLTTSANAIFLQSTAPLYLLLLAPLVLGERFHRRDIVYMAAVAAGMVFCFAGRPPAAATAPNPALGNMLGVASGLVWALTLLALRYIGRSDPSGQATVTAVLAGNAFAFFGALPAALPLPSASAGEWATLIYLGVFQIGLAYVFLSSAVRRLPALEMSLLLLMEPVLNPVWTWLIRHEDPGLWTIFGGAVIVSATAAKVVYDTSSTFKVERAE
jgi:drug/metabolite transporter (DMT)-like permease